jgi:hypothetical protein
MKKKKKKVGSKKERDFLSRNIVRYKREDTLVPLFTKRFSLPPSAKEMRFSDSAALPCIFKDPCANHSVFNGMERRSVPHLQKSDRT